MSNSCMTTPPLQRDEAMNWEYSRVRCHLYGSPVASALIDEIFTPAHLANELVELATARRRELGVVADFAAGDGALLRAAAQRQPRLEVVGLDIRRTQSTNCRP